MGRLDSKPWGIDYINRRKFLILSKSSMNHIIKLLKMRCTILQPLIPCKLSRYENMMTPIVKKLDKTTLKGYQSITFNIIYFRNYYYFM